IRLPGQQSRAGIDAGLAAVHGSQQPDRTVITARGHGMLSNIVWRVNPERIIMPKTSRPTSNKRAREKAQAERKKEKEQRRAEAKERKANAPARSGDEDPDLAGMQPGPQNKPDWLLELEDETNEDEA